MLLFVNNVIVESNSGDYIKSFAFFGRERNLNVRVIIKQYTGNHNDGIIKEIQLYSLLEVMIEKQTRQDVNKILQQGCLSGLPHMLAYKTSQNSAEMMMTYGGCSLDEWLPLLKDN